MDLSFMEMVVIGVIAFLVWGPEGLVKRAVQLGRFMAKVKNEVNNFKIMTQEELLKRSEIQDVKRHLDGLKLDETLQISDKKPDAKVEREEEKRRVLQAFENSGDAAKLSDEARIERALSRLGRTGD